MSKEKLISIGIGALLAASGAAVGYLADVAIPSIHEIGTPAALTIAAVASVAVNAFRKWREAT